MRANIQQIKRLLKTCNFVEIFREELGWSPLGETPPVGIDKGQQYTFTPLAHKAGFKIYLYTFQTQIPDEQTLKQIDRLVNVYAAEHLTIFVDAKQENQAWLWVKKEVNQPPVARLNRLNKQQSGELLAQKIVRLFVNINEEESITLTKVRDRVVQGFDVEKMTTRFYEHFKKERADFLQCIENIPDDDDRSWYTSIMLTRLMFVYFIQKKRLLDNRSSIRLDGDDGYLQNRLQKVRSEYGPDNFYTFYRYFLRRLFHEGLNQPDQLRPPALEGLIGRVPYINGGLFDTHVLEQRYPDIQISDQAFEQLFKFFEIFDWHLDDRPMRNDREINPDVLGYIFEKYVNQEQMGAYYTKEDITEYISKNTIIPFVFEQVAQRCPEAFLVDGAIWLQLRNNPDDYIYEELAHGLLEPLPPGIAAGSADIAQRTSWNRTAEERWALPTETWREVVERRHHHKELHTKIVEGELSTINALITYNLNITQFARDVIATCKEPALLHACYDAIAQVTVLDPTCGSGAFLFAALNVLKPLYQACIERMRQLVSQYKTPRKESNHITAFQTVLKRVDQHHSQEYFILKSIIINNLYGVDIMEEAIEICKLRLFLKLVAQIEKPQDLEPLPDIDFNVLAGNTLIGFSSLDEIRQVVTTKLLNIGDTERTLQLIEQDVKEIGRAEQSFRSLQTELGIKVDPTVKQQLRMKLSALRDLLNPYLATEYGKDSNNIPDKKIYQREYAQWRKRHKPFHWFVEFYGIMNKGGFDVIIGNPPYIEYSKVRKEYQVLGYKTESCGNLYSFVLERSFSLTREAGLVGMIVQLSSICTDRMSELQEEIRINSEEVWISNYDDRPAKLFDGLEHIRASIIISQISKKTNHPSMMHSTNLLRWYTECRAILFHRIAYNTLSDLHIPGSIPKIGEAQLKSLIRKVRHKKQTINDVYQRNSQHVVYYYRSPLYWIRSIDFLPLFQSAAATRSVHHLKNFNLTNVDLVKVVGCIINSSLFYLWFIVYGNGRNVALRDIQTFPCHVEQLYMHHGKELNELFSKLMKDYEQHSKIQVRKDGVKLQEFYPSFSKPIIDEIDRILAQHYGFTPEELDFIINYDIKYRMGRDNGEESEQ